MHIAAELAKIDVVEMLLKAGFDLTIQDKVRSSRANIVLEQIHVQLLYKQTCKYTINGLSMCFSSAFDHLHIWFYMFYSE